MFGPPWRKSKLRMLWICQWLAYAIFELNLLYQPSKAAVLGITAHAIIAYELSKMLNWANPNRYLKACEFPLTNEVHELAAQAIESLPIDPALINSIEVGLAIDKKGQRSKAPQHDWLTGTLDLAAMDGDRLIVLDHKTGRLKMDDVFERHDYVYLAKAHNPEIKEISFGRYWIRYEDTDWFHYRWERKGRGPQKLFIDDVEHDSRYLYTYIKEKIEHAESLKPIPTPGEHCENLYGEPCPFLGNECPLAHNGNLVPHESDVIVLPPDPMNYLIGMTPEQRIPAAYRMVLHGLPDDQITPEILDWAKQGHAHVQSANRKVNKRFKDMADRLCFQSGGKWHGMRPKRTVDVEQALSIMFGRDVPIKDMAKMISISKTGIENLPVEHMDTIEFLLENCVDEAGGEEFGPIKKVE